ncbi:MAG TPA: hypothetical protein VH280_09980 [Verrucomicrobiae bacterium]|jgi:hypothetical protein|nr:hypothetical protein [Verrucomicrobiae bacterium]
MDDKDASPKREPENLEPRPPVQNDLVALCRELNQRKANYVVVGGFAIIAAGFARLTGDVDLLVATDLENEAKVFSALSTLPDNAVKELRPGELEQYMVVRVGDEIIVDLMRMAGGIDYAEAAKDVVIHELDGVSIPFASPRLLWRMKAVTHRAKDEHDLMFLREWFAERGEEPPET